MSRTVDILFVAPGKSPEIRTVDGINDSADKALPIIYGLINSDIMEIRRPFAMRPDVVLVCDEEGKRNHNHNRPNRLIPELNDVICGPFFFAKSVASNDPEKGEEFTSLSVAEAAWLMGRFGSSGDF